MEDDKGLDLSLGLPVSRSTSKSNDKNSTSLATTSNDVDRTSKILSDFRNFLNGGIPQQPQGNYFNSFTPSAVIGQASGDGKGPMVGDKRKNLYEDMHHHKKQEADTENSDLHEKTRTSHISITTDDGSTADNEDVAEYEAETSRLVSYVEDNSKKHVDAHASSETSNELHGKAAGNHSPFFLQSVSTLNVPSSKTFKEATSSYPVSGETQPSTSGDRTQTLNAENTAMMFGYSHGQLPLLNKDSPWGMVARPPLLHPYSVRPLSASATLSGGKQPVVEEGSSSRAEDDAKVSNPSVIFTRKSATETHIDKSFPSEYPAIKPGMAADLKFGGSGTLPNLPWVSTTGPGPNGRTISGVTYRFSVNQIKIVCACHGLHLSPEEFIQHALDEPPAVTDSTAGGGGSGLASFSDTSNVAA